MRKIKTSAEYEAIMARVNQLVEIVDDETPTYDHNYIELDVLSDLVVAYEKQHYEIGKPELKDLLRDRMEEMNLNQKSLAERIGVSAPRINEYLSGKSLPTLQIAKKLHQELKIDGNVIFAAI